MWVSRAQRWHGWDEHRKETQWKGVRTDAGDWRGYTHSIVAGVALRELSCQFSTGTGMQVSLMVSWQRRDRGSPLSSSSWALLWTVSTIKGGGGAEGAEVRGVLEVESQEHRYGNRRPREEEGKKTRKTQKHMKQEQPNMRRESRVKPLDEPSSFRLKFVTYSHYTVFTTFRHGN